VVFGGAIAILSFGGALAVKWKYQSKKLCSKKLCSRC
jgi:hypothetical protein